MFCPPLRRWKGVWCICETSTAAGKRAWTVVYTLAGHPQFSALCVMTGNHRLAAALFLAMSSTSHLAIQ